MLIENTVESLNKRFGNTEEGPSKLEHKPLGKERRERRKKKKKLEKLEIVFETYRIRTNKRHVLKVSEGVEKQNDEKVCSMNSSTKFL